MSCDQAIETRASDLYAPSWTTALESPDALDAARCTGAGFLGAAAGFGSGAKLDAIAKAAGASGASAAAAAIAADGACGSAAAAGAGAGASDGRQVVLGAGSSAIAASWPASRIDQAPRDVLRLMTANGFALVLLRNAASRVYMPAFLRVVVDQA